jgi:hypothetical protein
MHFNESYAAGTEFGERLVDGTFVFALAVGEIFVRNHIVAVFRNQYRLQISFVTLSSVRISIQHQGWYLITTLMFARSSNHITNEGRY